MSFSRLFDFYHRLEQHPVAVSILSLFLGASLSCAFSPLEWFWLTPLLLALQFRFLTRAKNGLHAAWLFWMFGLGLFLAGVSWVYISIHVFGGVSMPMAAIPTLLLCMLLSCAHPLVGAAFRIHLPSSPRKQAILFATFIALLDLGRGWFFTGFPWLALGYSQTPPSPLAGYAPLFGVYGMSFAIALIAALLAIGSRAKPGPWLVALLILGCGALLRFVPWTHPVGEPIRVALIQSNFSQDQKWRPENFPITLKLFHKLVVENPAQLVVLPETAMPFFLDTIPQSYIAELKTLAKRQNGDLLIGVPTRAGERYWNSAVSFGTSPSQRYSKSHLVPFGEYVPPGFRWFMVLVNIPMVGFTGGPDNQPPLEIAGQRVAVNICYEDLFGQELLHALPRATLMVNMSNTAWFGRSLAQAQHLQIARLRALETGRPMLRATNTGMTAIIQPDGSVLAVLPPFESGALTETVQGYQGITPYILFGDIPIAFLILGVMIWFHKTEWRKRSPALKQF